MHEVPSSNADNDNGETMLNDAAETVWKPFLFESNQWFDPMDTPAAFDRIREAHPEMTDEQILACKEATYNGCRTLAARDTHPNYGLRSEHDGQRTLGDFFRTHGMQVPPRMTPCPVVLEVEEALKAYLVDLDSITDLTARLDPNPCDDEAVNHNARTIASINDTVGMIKVGTKIILKEQSMREPHQRG